MNIDVELAICYLNHTWRKELISFEVDDEDPCVECEIADRAEDEWRRKNPTKDVSAIGMITFEKEPEWLITWGECGDEDTVCPKCGKCTLKTHDHSTECSTCLWHGHNAIRARADEDAGVDITRCSECTPRPKNGVLRLGWEQWVRMFQPIKNTLNPNAPYDGFMFETYGPEYEAVVRAQADLEYPNRVWTLISGEADEITEGWHYVNRLGYFITSEPYDPALQYHVDETTDEDFDDLSEDELEEEENET